ncbi:MAG: dihydrofolate reductase [Candidatus Colwellbacteria bacterium]
MAKISIIAAIGKYDNSLGSGGDLIWRLSVDLKRFKELTMGHPIIMGRKTFESIGRALPGRTNIVITRNSNYQAGGIEIVDSLEKAIEQASKVDDEEIFIIGGGEIFKESISLVDKLYLTLIDARAKDFDVLFPDYSDFTKKTFEENGEEGGIKYTWVNLERA